MKQKGAEWQVYSPCVNPNSLHMLFELLLFIELSFDHWSIHCYFCTFLTLCVINFEMGLQKYILFHQGHVLSDLFNQYHASHSMEKFEKPREVVLQFSLGWDISGLEPAVEWHWCYSCEWITQVTLWAKTVLQSQSCSSENVDVQPQRQWHTSTGGD